MCQSSDRSSPPSSIANIRNLCRSKTLLFIWCLAAICASAGATAGGNVDLQSRTPSEPDAAVDGLFERYVPEFFGVNREIIGRASDDEIQTLGNNNPVLDSISFGQSQYFRFPKDSLFAPKSPVTPGLPSSISRRSAEDNAGNDGGELKKRQGQRPVNLYLTLNVCSQPTADGGDTNGRPDQLKVYVSTSSNNQKPNAGSSSREMTLNGGYGNMTVQANDDTFIGVEAPEKGSFSGQYSFELAASIDDFYASSLNTALSSDDSFAPELVDTGSTNALFYTGNISNASTPEGERWMKTAAFNLYIFHQDNPSLVGLQNSMCALKNNSEIKISSDDETSMFIDANNMARQRFFVQGLNGSVSYYAALGIDGNSTDSGNGVVGGGGTSFPVTSFKTKSDNNCDVIYDLEFCSDVAYAVPTNPDNPTFKNNTALGEKYDSYAKQAYVAFNKSLQQIPCETTSSAQYSLARSCADCERDYRRWLCAVTIPRCEDFSNSSLELVPRAIGLPFNDPKLGSQFKDDPAFNQDNKTLPFYNNSRNPMIDTDIVPGPYKEMLPCETLCHRLVQSCPAALQFSCPEHGFGLENTYGRTGSCNSLQWPVRAAGSITISGRRALLFAAFLMLYTAIT